MSTIYVVGRHLHAFSVSTRAIWFPETYGSCLSCHFKHFQKYSSSASVYLRPGIFASISGGGVGEREGVAEKRTRCTESMRVCERPRDELRLLAGPALAELPLSVVRPLDATRSSLNTVLGCDRASSSEDIHLESLS